MSITVSQRFAKFNPGPDGPSQYPDNPKGFDLVEGTEPSVTNQGSGSGAKFDYLTLVVRGTTVDYAQFKKRVVQNDKTPTKLTVRAMYTQNKAREPLETSEYEGIEFKDAQPNFVQGEQEGIIYLKMSYTKVTSQLKAFDAKGKAKPSAKSMADLEKGMFE